MQQMSTVWITTHEARILTDFSPARLQTLAKKQWVRARKQGRRWLYDEEFLQYYKTGKWLGVREASKLTRYSETHLRYLASKGRVKARKVGGWWLILRSSLLAYCGKHGRA